MDVHIEVNEPEKDYLLPFPTEASVYEYRFLKEAIQFANMRLRNLLILHDLRKQ